jgi:hypothetical protein
MGLSETRAWNAATCREVYRHWRYGQNPWYDLDLDGCTTVYRHSPHSLSDLQLSTHRVRLASISSETSPQMALPLETASFDAGSQGNPEGGEFP